MVASVGRTFRLTVRESERQGLSELGGVGAAVAESVASNERASSLIGSFSTVGVRGDRELSESKIPAGDG